MKHLFIACLVTLGLTACSSEEPKDPPKDEQADCSRGQLEADLTFNGPLAGPAVRADGTLAPGRYTVSSTYLRLKPDAEGQARFQELVMPVGQALRSQPGLMALQFASSVYCNTARTFSVWKDDASMYEFVSGPAHLDAMSAVSEVSRGGSIVTHWADDEKGASWQKAAQQLSADEGPFY
ncbi:hypothetical protein [Hyalangium rubrum]|uniref:ABM domain-containing protein n=1 Tax=Hyalangium rubrum TaxID=3103134 RepID=A0ABU5GZK1_9BACT|nr:hypothetical protein [Hyalangium sp. s54d21]MDY7226575.1 hypothetical protein [Hyalangium sp. s54d21]